MCWRRRCHFFSGDPSFLQHGAAEFAQQDFDGLSQDSCGQTEMVGDQVAFGLLEVWPRD